MVALVAAIVNTAGSLANPHVTARRNSLLKLTLVLPRISLRNLLSLAAGVCLLAVVVARAVQGDHWAIGITVGIASLIVTWVVYAVLYGIVMTLGLLVAPHAAADRLPVHYPQRTPSPRTPDPQPEAMEEAR